MKLSKFSAKHFRCLYDVAEIPFHPITVLIGENDGGKTATLEALYLFFSRNASPIDRDYSYIPGSPPEAGEENSPKEDSMTLEAEFDLDEAELQQLNESLLVPLDRLMVRKLFSRGGAVKTEIRSLVSREPKLQVDPDALPLPQIKSLAGEFGASLPGGTARDPILREFKAWLRTQPMEEGWQPAPKQVLAILPEYEIVKGGSDPDAVVSRILSVTYRDELQKEENRQLLERLEGQLCSRLQERASSLGDVIKKYVPTIQDVLVNPQFSFEGAFQRAPLQLVGWNGKPIDLAMRGTGLRQQVTMAAYEWSSGVLETREQEGARHLILAFDEPDIHLDYKAQRHLYNIISGFADKNLQVIIATHSINFINRVPVHQINHYSLALDHSCTAVECLRISSDPQEQEFFLHDLGRAMGLENSTMFYERCFLAYEGKTEEGALPILFKLCCGASTHACGVRLVNSYDNYGAIVFAKFMHRNNRTVLFMVDEDTTINKGTARHLTPQSLQKEGFPLDRAHFVRPGCFEYAFSNDIWSRVLNKYQYESDKEWTPDHVQALRTTPKEFQKAIERILQEESKPRAGMWLAEAIRSPAEIPQGIRDCLMKANTLANPLRPTLGVDMSESLSRDHINIKTPSSSYA